ncbi:hypothetical protein CL630_03210 [bacterium]|mgnify:CR=1 FL=1|nr:hypothetical protein [bacterium]|tara:strand:- start:145 stop:540 length:396 start_codon:yes stop_codon:yes gene_type:complete
MKEGYTLVQFLYGLIALWIWEQKNYPFGRFLDDIVELYRWEQPKTGVVTNLFERKRSMLEAKELEAFKQFISEEAGQTILFFCLLGLFVSFFFYFLYDGNWLRIVFSFLLVYLTYLVLKAYMREIYEFLKN